MIHDGGQVKKGDTERGVHVALGLFKATMAGFNLFSVSPKARLDCIRG